VAIQALAEVRKQHAEAKLLIIGEHDGSEASKAYAARLRHLAKDLNLADAVIFAGFLPATQMPAAIASCTVCVLPSESESFGMVLMEAWAQGVPTVASDVSGCREITLASEGGKLCPVGDIAAFSGSISEFLRNRELAVNMGLRGKIWVNQACNPLEYSRAFHRIASSV
jgi:glycogen synthase